MGAPGEEEVAQASDEIGRTAPGSSHQTEGSQAGRKRDLLLRLITTIRRGTPEVTSRPNPYPTPQSWGQPPTVHRSRCVPETVSVAATHCGPTRVDVTTHPMPSPRVRSHFGALPAWESPTPVPDSARTPRPRRNDDRRTSGPKLTSDPHRTGREPSESATRHVL